VGPLAGACDIERVTGLYYALGALALALGIGVSIALHEIGHLVPAKRFGVRVTQYMVGFGPTLWSRRREETEYGIKAIPLGGYIRMIGMFPPKPGEDPRLVRASSTGRMGLMVDSAVQARANRRTGLAEQARQQSMEEIRPGDEDRVFYKLSVPRKVVVMLGGPMMNLVIAAVLIAVTTSGFGVLGSTTTVQTVSECVLPASAPVGQQCSPTDPRAPAAEAGVRPGDRLLAFDGQAITTWEQARTAIRAAGGRTVRLTVERDGQPLELTATVPSTPRPVVGDDGRVALNADGTPRTERVGFVGLSPLPGLVQRPLSDVPGILGDGLAQTAGVVLRIPQKMVGVAQAAFGGGERDPNGPIGVVGVTRVAGEIASSQDIQFVQGPRARVSFLLSLLASLNLALFVFNLIPLLPLDGGHVAGALYEGARRVVARLRRRPDPGPTDVARLLPVAYAVSSVLVLMSVLLIYADVVNPVRIGG
jgi:membrane-associated protease RseP (regulator of RpoE activity)